MQFDFHADFNFRTFNSTWYSYDLTAMIWYHFFASNSRCKIAPEIVANKCLKGVGICLYVAKRRIIIVLLIILYSIIAIHSKNDKIL